MPLDLTARATNNRAASAELAATYSELWGSAQQPIVHLMTSELEAYTKPDGSGQPYRMQQDKIDAISLSIEDIGIMQPIVVRKHNGKYQILSGHHRWAAAQKCGLNSVPCIIHECDNDTAYKIVAESNTRTGEYLPTENAKIFSEYFEKYTGSVADIFEIIAQKFSVSRKTIYRYLNLLKLEKCLQPFVDNKKIPFGQFEKIINSLNTTQQRTLADYIIFYDEKINAKRLNTICELSMENRIITIDDIYEALHPDEHDEEQSEEASESPVETKNMFREIRRIAPRLAELSDAEISDFIINIVIKDQYCY